MFGERLAQLRKSRKLSQYELADRLGFSRGQVANYEQGKREPDYATLQKFADFFEVSTDYLLGRNDETVNGLSEDEKEMLEFFRNPEVGLFFKEMKESPEEQLEELREIWEVIKKRNKKK